MQAIYPISRYRRLEAGLQLASVKDTRQSLFEPYDQTSGFLTREPTVTETSLGTHSYAQPAIGMVFDNSLPGYVGPFYGRRYRLNVGQTIGDWRFTQATVDYRRYDHLFGPFTFATHALYFGRIGRDAQEFKVFLGHTDLLRGNTSGSYERNECLDPATLGGSQTGCIPLDRLIGTQLAVGSAELRFPLLNASLGFVPIGFPPIEGALFFDAGLAWDQNSTLKWTRAPGDDPLNVRTPLTTIGTSIRVNALGLAVVRFDYSFPRGRSVKGFWTVSIGPTW
jgi:outer membrane protein assembly factor BamA